MTRTNATIDSRSKISHFSGHNEEAFDEDSTNSGENGCDMYGY
jgi:hypothetical protein